MEDPTKVIDLDEARAEREERARRLEDARAAFVSFFEVRALSDTPSGAIVPDKVDAPKPQGDGPPKDVTRVPPKRGRRGKKAPAHAPYLFRNMTKNVKDGRHGHIEALR